MAAVNKLLIVQRSLRNDSKNITNYFRATGMIEGTLHYNFVITNSEHVSLVKY